MTEENILFKEVKKTSKKSLTDLLRCDNLDWLSQTTETGGDRKSVV